jgi:putative cardiolipin synthase
VRISTNSLASTDNLLAFSGYHKQRASLLSAGIDVFEFRPNPDIQRTLINRYHALEKQVPVFAIHAKTLVIDGKTLFVGTFNLDPRSANLNTEVGVLIHNPMLAAQVEANILLDMQPGNSWDARNEDADAKAPLSKRIKLPLLKMLPLKPVL